MAGTTYRAFSWSEYSRVFSGETPWNFGKLCADALQLNMLASREMRIEGETHEAMSDRLRDCFLIVAYTFAATRHKEEGNERDANAHALVERARQIAAWCRRAPPATTLVEVLENQAREVARVVAEKLFVGQGFLVVVFDEDKDGGMSWSSSLPATRAIGIAERFATILREGQADKS